MKTYIAFQNEQFHECFKNLMTALQFSAQKLKLQTNFMLFDVVIFFTKLSYNFRLTRVNDANKSF